VLGRVTQSQVGAKGQCGEQLPHPYAGTVHPSIVPRRSPTEPVRGIELGTTPNRCPRNLILTGGYVRRSASLYFGLHPYSPEGTPA
jgi:hypothetical protein